ncbi:MAG: DUF805 domain-containing protein [Pseudomonadota bacterium]
MISAVSTCFQKYVTFSGRASRREFWYFILFMVLCSALLVVVNSALFGPEIRTVGSLDADGNVIPESVRQETYYNGGRLDDVFLLICLLPWLAVTWRRMHDSGLPGYLPFLTVLMFIGLCFLIVAANLGLEEMWRQIRATGQVQVTLSNGVQTTLLFLGALWMLITNIFLLCRRSDAAPNKYGPNPNEVLQ